MSNQMFNQDFIPMLQDGIKEFINNMFEDGVINIKIKRDLNLNIEKDSEKVDELVEIVFNTDNDFADYFMSKYQYEPDMKLEMIIFCNTWLDENYGTHSILDWKRYNDPFYVVSNMAYVYIQANKDEFVKILNDIKNELLLLAEINYLK